MPLPAVVRAMAFACASLADGKAADGHADFYTVLLMHADRLLAPLVPESTSTAWRRDLARIVPEKIYRRQPTDATTNNWNLVAVAGEWMRTKAGLGDSLPWIEASLDRQLELFTPWGMYRDPNDPMAYDHFARLWALDLLDEGYRAATPASWRNCVERGAGCRSSCSRRAASCRAAAAAPTTSGTRPQQAVTFESWASRFARRGDQAAAGACKRGAQPIAVSRSGGGPDRRATSGSSRTAWTRPRGTATSRTRSTRSTTCWPPRCSPSPGRAPTNASTSRLPGRRRRAAIAFALQPAFHKVFVKSGSWLPRDRHRRRPATTTRRAYCACTIGVLLPETISDGVSAAASYQLPSKPTRFAGAGAGVARPGRSLACPRRPRRGRPRANRVRGPQVDANAAGAAADLSGTTAWRRQCRE